MKWNYQSWIVLAAGGLLLSGCVDRAAQKQAQRTQELVTSVVKPVVATQVRSETLTDSIEITGEVTTSDDVTVGAKVAGRLIAVNIKDGDPVVKGQIIAQQDTSTQQINLQQAISQQASARANLTQAIANMKIGRLKSYAAVQAAQAQLKSDKSQLDKALNGARPEEKAQADAAVASAKSNLETARKTRDRKRELLGQGAISQEEFDQAENAFESAASQYQSALQDQKMKQSWSRPEDIEVARVAVKAAQENLNTAKATKDLDSVFQDQVDSAKAALETATSQVKFAEQAIQDATIRAPFDGRVDGKPAQAGSVPGSGGAIVHIVGKAGTYFEGQLSENDIAKVNEGSQVKVTLDSLGGRDFPGHVAAISPSASTVGRLFTVRVQLDGPTTDIKPGMFARGQVTIRKVQDATVVPAEAIVQQNGGDFVFVVENDKAHKVKVEVGLKQGDWTEVKGVSVGAKVVTTGQSDLTEGTQIRVDTAQAATSVRGT